MVDNEIALPICKANSFLDDSKQAEYIIRYLTKIGCKTAIREESYVDRDYLIEYAHILKKLKIKFENLNEYFI
jgi:hypothetical protein